MTQDEIHREPSVTLRMRLSALDESNHPLDADEGAKILRETDQIRRELARRVGCAS